MTDCVLRQITRLLRGGAVEGSRRYLEQAIRLQPTYPQAHFNLARALAARGRYAEATRAAATAEEQAIAAGQTELVAAIRDQFRR
jgi:Flp pilus assembly protein TadD